MRKLFLILISYIFTSLVNAQTYTMVDRFNSSQMYGESGYYYRDTQGFFNIYKGGTWLYTNNNISIQLRFDVKTFLRNTDGNENFKTDALIGGIHIVKNGVEVLNSLYDIQQNKQSNTDYSIYNGYRLPNTPDCYNCTIPNQRLHMYYNEPNNDNNAFTGLFFDMHVYFNTQNQPVLRVVFTEEALQGIDPNSYDAEFETPPTKTQLFFPFGTYDFVKVP